MICKMVKTIAGDDGQLAMSDGTLFGEFLASGWTILAALPGVSVRETYLIVSKTMERCDAK